MGATSRGTPFRRVNAPGLLTMAVLVGLWEALVRSGLLEYDYLPAPSAVAQAAGALLVAGGLVRNVVHTLTVALVGWVASAVIGIGLGILLGISRTAWRYSITTFEALKPIPPITLVPAALLVFGFSLEMELVIVIYVGVWPVLINTIGGVRGVSPELRDTARMLRFRPFAAVAKVILPAAMPVIAVGLRLALSLCLVLAVVAEMVGNPAGLGHALVRAQHALQPERMFVYVVATGVLGITINAAFDAAARKVFPSLDAARGGDAPSKRAELAQPSSRVHA